MFRLALMLPSTRTKYTTGHARALVALLVMVSFLVTSTYANYASAFVITPTMAAGAAWALLMTMGFMFHNQTAAVRGVQWVLDNFNPIGGASIVGNWLASQLTASRGGSINTSTLPQEAETELQQIVAGVMGGAPQPALGNEHVQQLLGRSALLMPATGGVTTYQVRGLRFDYANVPAGTTLPQIHWWRYDGANAGQTEVTVRWSSARTGRLAGTSVDTGGGMFRTGTDRWTMLISLPTHGITHFHTVANRDAWVAQNGSILIADVTIRRTELEANRLSAVGIDFSYWNTQSVSIPIQPADVIAMPQTGVTLRGPAVPAVTQVPHAIVAVPVDTSVLVGANPLFPVAGDVPLPATVPTSVGTLPLTKEVVLPDPNIGVIAGVVGGLYALLTTIKGAVGGIATAVGTLTGTLVARFMPTLMGFFNPFLQLVAALIGLFARIMRFLGDIWNVPPTTVLLDRSLVQGIQFVRDMQLPILGVTVRQIIETTASVVLALVSVQFIRRQLIR